MNLQYLKPHTAIRISKVTEENHNAPIYQGGQRGFFLPKVNDSLCLELSGAKPVLGS